MAYYDAFEGLAEYYMEKILGEKGFFTDQAKYVELYKANESKNYSVKEMFELGKNMEAKH